jgi:hypothetical protein
MDHTNCLQVAIKTIQFNSGLLDAGDGEADNALIDAAIQELKSKLDAEDRAKNIELQELNTKYKREEMKKFRDFFTRFGLTREDIETFGNCQFLSLAQQLLWLERIRMKISTSITSHERASLGKKLRTEDVSYMQHKDNKDLFEPFVAPAEGTLNALDSGTDVNYNAFCTRMSKDYQQGDNMTLRALALARKVNIQVFKYSTCDNDIRMYHFPRSLPGDTDSGADESQVPAAEMLSKPETLNIVHYVYQHGSSGHYESIVSPKVRCSIDA